MANFGGFDLFGGDTPDFGTSFDFNDGGFGGGGSGLFTSYDAGSSLYGNGSDLMSQFGNPASDPGGLGEWGGYSQTANTPSGARAFFVRSTAEAP